MKTLLPYFRPFGLICLILLLVGLSEPVAEQPLARRILEPSPNTDGVIKILLFADMEGVSGQSPVLSFFYPHEDYPRAQEALTGDLNAVIEGIFAAGADSVHLIDAHGSRNPGGNILVDRLDKRAEVLDLWDGSMGPYPYLGLAEQNDYDAIVAVGQHSHTGGGGFAAHTYNFGMGLILNGMPISESEIIAYGWGKLGVPLILVTGDDTLQKQLSWMSWVEYVMVKSARGMSEVDVRDLAKVRSEMTSQAIRAVRNLPKSRAVELCEPIKAEVKASLPASLNLLEGVPGIDYDNETVTFQAQDFVEALKGFLTLVRVGRHSYSRIFADVVKGHVDKPSWRSIQDECWDRILLKWIEVESGI